MAKFQLTNGVHYENGVRYFAGNEDILESDVDLAGIFPDKFIRLDDSTGEEDVSESEDGGVDSLDIPCDDDNSVPIVHVPGADVLKQGDFKVGDRCFGRKGAFGRFYLHTVDGEKTDKSFKTRDELIAFVLEEDIANGEGN